jgi:hypothetical protein
LSAIIIHHLVVDDQEMNKRGQKTPQNGEFSVFLGTFNLKKTAGLTLISLKSIGTVF